MSLHPGSIIKVSLSEAKAIISSDVPRRTIRKTIWHHFIEPSAADYRGIQTIANVRHWQMNDRKPKMKDFSYHWATGPNGDIFTGRPVRGMMGAHALGHNVHSIGLGMCLNGDEENLNDFPAMREAMLALTLHICGVYHLTEEDLHWHRDFSSKSCPGKLLDRDYYRALLCDRFAGIDGTRWVRLKLNDEPVKAARLVNEGGSVIVKLQFQWFDERRKPQLFRAGESIRSLLEAKGFDVYWRGQQGPSGTIFAYR